MFEYFKNQRSILWWNKIIFIIFQGLSFDEIQNLYLIITSLKNILTPIECIIMRYGSDAVFI